MRNFIYFQIKLCLLFDKLLPIRFRIDGNKELLCSIVPKEICNGLTVWDVGGGGSQPAIEPSTKMSLDLYIVGLDIDQAELDAAPIGSYDETICADLTSYRGHGNADLVLCHTVLEHVRNAEGAFEAISTILKTEGRAIIFVPCRNAVFARLNRMLPEKLKRTILFNIFPHKALGHDGMKAYYDKCTPKDFRKLATKHGFIIDFEKYYYTSSYFSFFLPFWILWRLWILVRYFLFKEHASEAFIMILRARPENN